jgi:hypothetical protein
MHIAPQMNVVGTSIGARLSEHVSGDRLSHWLHRGGHAIRERRVDLGRHTS